MDTKPLLKKFKKHIFKKHGSRDPPSKRHAMTISLGLCLSVSLCHLFEIICSCSL